MDDIVVIILTLIVAVFGILNKKRKKDVASGEPSPAKTPDFWNMLMEDNEDLPPKPQPQVIHQEEEEKEPVQHAGLNFEYDDEVKESQLVKKKMKRKKISKKKTEILGEKFSLKKAVIYSEIINRKYI